MVEETEPGIGSYISRYLLGDDYLRLDDGNDDGDFILFNLKSREIHSFNHEDRTHLLITPQQAEAVEFDLEFKVSRRELTDAPVQDGVHPVEYSFLANGELCKKAVSVEGLLMHVADALKQYEQVLTAQSISSLSRIPPAYRTACYMANNYLHVSDYLEHGFPLFMQDDQGREKRLLSYETVNKPARLFEFPAGYRRYQPDNF